MFCRSQSDAKWLNERRKEQRLLDLPPKAVVDLDNSHF